MPSPSRKPSSDPHGNQPGPPSLPHDLFEWQSDAYFQAAGIASQDDRVSVRRETAGDFLVTMREGMLLEQQERGFVASSVWDQGRENPKGWMVSPLFAIVTRRREDLASKFSSYQAAASYEVYARETAARFWDGPTERAALAELFQLFYISGPHPDYRRRFTPEELAPFQAGWSGGIKPIFLIALLLLLNSRNGVETQLIKHERLNRARARRRQPPLADYRIVDLRLGKARSAAGDAAGLTAGPKAPTPVSGPFQGPPDRRLLVVAPHPRRRPAPSRAPPLPGRLTARRARL